MIQRFRKCWLQDKNKLGVQLLSDLGSCSRLSYIFWILNMSNLPQRPTYILSLNSRGYLRCHGLQQCSGMWYMSKRQDPNFPAEHCLMQHTASTPASCLLAWERFWTAQHSTRAAVLKMLWPSCLANTTWLQHLALAQFPYFNNLGTASSIFTGSVLPCSCSSLTATSLCTTWGTEVDMASHFCTTSYSCDT